MSFPGNVNELRLELRTHMTVFGMMTGSTEMGPRGLGMVTCAHTHTRVCSCSSILHRDRDLVLVTRTPPFVRAAENVGCV